MSHLAENIRGTIQSLLKRFGVPAHAKPMNEDFYQLCVDEAIRRGYPMDGPTTCYRSTKKKKPERLPIKSLSSHPITRRPRSKPLTLWRRQLWSSLQRSRRFWRRALRLIMLSTSLPLDILCFMFPWRGASWRS